MFGSDAELALRGSVGDNTCTHNSDSDYRLKTSGRTVARENIDEFVETKLKKMAVHEKYCVRIRSNIEVALKVVFMDGKTEHHGTIDIGP